MYKTNRLKLWLLPVAALVLFALLFATTAYAAQGGEGEEGLGGETEASVSFTAGELRLVSVPVLDFGSHAISDQEQVYPAVSASPQIQVSDLRGNAGGWDLFVSLSAFALEDNGSPTLNAAAIEMTSPTVSAVNGSIGTPPSAYSLLLTSDSTETPVLKAAQNEGMGVWGLSFGPANTTLTVKPGTAREGRSVATLTWSLQSTP